MSERYFNAAGAWHAATAWVDKELHRWGICLLIVIAIHAGLIASFEAWKAAVDQPEPPSGAVMIDLGPLPGPGGHGEGNKPRAEPQHSAIRLPEHTAVKKHEHFQRLIKLRTRLAHLPKPPPKVLARLPPNAVALPQPQSHLIASSNTMPAAGIGSIRVGAGVGDSVGAAGGCCGGDAGAMGVGQGGPATWQGLLLAALEAHKHYPPSAQERGEQGVVYLRFAMDRRGKVLSFSLEKSCGFGDLDQETLDLIQRSQPLPPPPPTVTGSVIELVVPVQFELQQAD